MRLLSLPIGRRQDDPSLKKFTYRLNFIDIFAVYAILDQQCNYAERQLACVVRDLQRDLRGRRG
jgi:hypothetical protein